MLPNLLPTAPTDLLSWGLQSTLVLGAGWLLYRYVLRQERFFSYNQQFLTLLPWLALLGPLLVRAALPALLRQLPVAATGALVQAQLPGLTVWPGAVLPGAAIDFAPHLPALYALGVALLLLRLLGQLGHLWLSTRQLPRTPGPGYVLVHTGGRRPVSSFGRWIFWDDTAPLTPAEARTVLAHEVAHVRQHHTRQRLLLEVARALLWFNPFAYLFPRALAQTHEFLADATALHALQPTEASATTPDPAPYAALLARLALRQLGPNLSLTHSFTQSLTLTRIRMLTTAAPVHRWKRWLPLPLSAGLLLSLVACQETIEPNLKEPGFQKAESLKVLTISDGSKPAPHQPGAPYTYVEQMPEYEGGQEKLLDDIGKLVKYPPAAIAAKVEGRAFVKFIVGADGTIQAATVQKGVAKPGTPAALAQELDEIALNAVRNLPGKWTPGRKDGKAVAVSYTVPITFALK
ncbi:TonB family protein [Hymenobacter sp. NST-14]|uniref:M56 family metallopeptidase n=1 Tax=Hymenobacter piscis TaxID=2839984 RepID=UPI001C0171B1|nr:M56 family metallopeptidase [Hymenobacter piscis]MBT9393066.1 TonB family protein [Hymenobacter piscis]